jgi:hypothetical protein
MNIDQNMSTGTAANANDPALTNDGDPGSDFASNADMNIDDNQVSRPASGNMQDDAAPDGDDDGDSGDDTNPMKDFPPIDPQPAEEIPPPDPRL